MSTPLSTSQSLSNSASGIDQVLKQYWGYDEFRPLQKEAMAAVLQSRDSVVVLPTGGGKSLCYQAPAVLMPGVAVVVSPLISLMKDQVDALRENGIPAARLDSTIHPMERDMILDEIEQGQLKLLYVSPERLLSEGFLTYLQKIELSFLAIDEAHCVSMWGHDFRPEYRQLGQLKDMFPGMALHAYTATATQQVQDDIAVQLKLSNPEILVGSFDRPNLLYKVERRERIIDQVRSILDRHRNESGIIYCIRRADVDGLCEELKRLGYSVRPYHAGMGEMERKANQDAFFKEEVDTIVATIAFGMGIDKSNVRYVIHTGMPKSLEHYQQESGRAGRDGLHAECYLFYSGGDYGTWQKLMSNMPDEAKAMAIKKLRELYDFCNGVLCRHNAILQYFGQSLDKDNCQACDVCLGDMDLVDDALVIGQKILSCIKRLDEQFGADYTTSVLTGSKDKRILGNQHDKLSTYGLMSDLPKRNVRDWIEQLVSQGYAKKTGEFNVLQVTQKGWRILKGQETPRLLKPSAKKKEAKAKESQREAWEGVDNGLFEELRNLRRRIAEKKDVPAYIVFGDAALQDMARIRPISIDMFRKVSGVGEKKCNEYGETFTKFIQQYCHEHSLETNVKKYIAPESPRHSSSSSIPTQTKREAFELFRQGKPVDEVANQVKRAASTTHGYLIDFLREEGIDDPSPWVDQATRERILKSAHLSEDGRLKPIFEALSEEVPYEVIRIVMTCKENEHSG